jgi:hypothetical protein
MLAGAENEMIEAKASLLFFGSAAIDDESAWAGQLPKQAWAA